ncbi:MAG: hypothetical protein HY941_09900 [Gammaproteobacteria bacterium]|nr:hypothetical protein [Gammaproteobacteria bacterium]
MPIDEYRPHPPIAWIKKGRQGYEKSASNTIVIPSGCIEASDVTLMFRNNQSAVNASHPGALMADIEISIPGVPH